MACLCVVTGARADPVETANEALVRFWNTARRVVFLEARKAPRDALPAPLKEQLIRIRSELLPMLELDLRHDLEQWLAEVDTAISDFNEGRFKKLSEVIALVHTRRKEGRTSPGFHSRWLDDPEAKKLKVWLGPLVFDPLMPGMERDVSEGDELLSMWGFRLEPTFEATGGWPPRTSIWCRVIKEPTQEAAEKELARRVASRQVNPIYRKTVIVVTMRPRGDGWIIERLRWLARLPAPAQKRD